MDKNLDRRWAARLVEIFRDRYPAEFGRAFAGMREAELLDCWSEELAGKDAAQIKRGLAWLDSVESMPHLLDFVEACQ